MKRLVVDSNHRFHLANGEMELKHIQRHPWLHLDSLAKSRHHPPQRLGSRRLFSEKEQGGRISSLNGSLSSAKHFVVAVVQP